MANATVPSATWTHGTNPQYLIEKILRTRIYECRYWKEMCFGLTAETLIERAVLLDSVGATYSHNSRPTNFVCLLLKLLQIAPTLDIARAYTAQGEYKYLRALGAFYVRLTAPALEVHRILEPLLRDPRKLALRSPAGWRLSTVDAFVDELLTGEICCDITVPRMTRRSVFVEAGDLEPRDAGLEALLADAAAAGDDVTGAGVGAKGEGAGMSEDTLTAGRRDIRPAWMMDGGGATAVGGGHDEGAPSVAKRPREPEDGSSEAAAASKKPSYAPWPTKKTAPSEAAGRSASDGVALADATNPHAEGSKEYWNVERAKLGLAPLRG